VIVNCSGERGNTFDYFRVNYLDPAVYYKYFIEQPQPHKALSLVNFTLFTRKKPGIRRNSCE